MNTSSTQRLLALAALTCPLAGPAAAAPIDDLRDFLRDESRRQDFGAHLQGVAGFGALPGISGSHFTVDGSGAADDASLSRLNVPLSHEFENIGIAGGNLYAEASLGWLQADYDIRGLFAGTPLRSDAHSDIDAFSALGGVGLSFDLNDCWSLTPMAVFGYSRIEDETSFTGRGAGRVDKITRDILFNYHVDDFLYGAAVELDYERKLAGDIDLEAEFRYNLMFSESTSASDPSLESSADFGVLTSYIQLDGPTPASLWNRPIRWIGFLSNSTFFRDAADGLGFDTFVEIGGGVEIVDPNIVSGVQGVSLRGSVLVGDNVTGWSAGAKLEF